MAYIKVKGIVIREVNTGEADKIITLFTDRRGKISVYLKNARRMKSKGIASGQLFCYSEFVLFKGKDMYSLNSSDTIESFYNIRCDLFKLTYASHILEIIGDVIQEEQSSYNTLKLLLNTLFKLNQDNENGEIITRIFEFRLMKILGYSPIINSCAICDNKNFEEVYFSFQENGFICENCKYQSTNKVHISNSTAKAIIHIINSDLNNLFKFSVNDEILNEISGISEKYIQIHLEKKYKKLEYLKGL